MNIPYFTITRVFVYIADIIRISGRGPTSGRAMYHQIREFFNLQKHHQVTIFHLSEYFNMPLFQVVQFIK